jgi:hypothetical protein
VKLAFTAILKTVIPAKAGTHAERPTLQTPRQCDFKMDPDFHRDDGSTFTGSW